MSVQVCSQLIHKIVSSGRLNERQRKELLLSHLPRIFPESNEEASAFAMGAEAYVKTAKSYESDSKRGFVDTLLGQVILEFKDNLSSSTKKKDAELELKRYVAALWTSKGVTSSFVCVATDVLEWNIYHPVSKRVMREGEYTADDVHLELTEKTKITSNSENHSRLLYELLKKIIVDKYIKFLNAESLNFYFGFSSAVFKSFNKSILPLLERITERDGQVKLFLDIWKKQQEYNALKFSNNQIALYSKHLYLVLLARMIVAIHLVPNRKEYDDVLLCSILNGDFFKSRKVENYVEEDYFCWVNFDRYRKSLFPTLNNLYHSLISFRIEEGEDESILNHLYNELLPESQKSVWGQRCTPIALASNLINEIKDVGNSSILDPACGSGNFIKAFFKKLKDLKKISPSDLAQKSFNIVGIDIDPVSICISKSVWLLQVYDALPLFPSSVDIPIYHADSLFLLSDATKQGKPRFVFDGENIEIPKIILNDPRKMDAFISWCQLAAYHLSQKDAYDLLLNDEQVCKMADASVELQSLNFKDSQILNCAKSLIISLWKRIVENRNSIWGFVLRNAYKPIFLKEKFDFIVMNPPWLAMSSVSDIPYKKMLESRSLKFCIKPSGSSFLHTEIATVFFLHCLDFYLKEGGCCLCILPRSIFNGDHHDKFRRGKYFKKVRFEIERVWDLDKIEELFAVPSVVLFARKSNVVFAQKFPIKTITHKGSIGKITEGEIYDLSFNASGKKSSWGISSCPDDSYEDSYLNLFKQGADIMPRTVCFVDVKNKGPDVVSIETSAIERANKRNKKLQGVLLEGKIRKRFIFKTLTSSHLLPFYVVEPLPLVALPMEYVQGSLIIVDSDKLLDNGFFETKDWFDNVDKKIKEVGGKSFRERINTRGKLVKQKIFENGYMVHYGAGGTNPAAAILDCSHFNSTRFVADQTTYFFYTESFYEASFVSGVLNSSIVSQKISSFQSKGSFGERHIHKLPLQLIPRYDSGDSAHLSIAKFSMNFSKNISKDDDPRIADVAKPISSRRKYFRNKYKDELKKLDNVVSEIFKDKEMF